MMYRDRFGNYVILAYVVSAQRNIPAPYTRPRTWETLTPIGNLPAVADEGVLAQSRYNRRLFHNATRPQTRRQIRPQQKPIGRGRPESLIRILLRR